MHNYYSQPTTPVGKLHVVSIQEDIILNKFDLPQVAKVITINKDSIDITMRTFEPCTLVI